MQQWSGRAVITIEWTSSEELLCIQDDGTVSLFDMFGSFQNSFHMGQEAKDTKIIDAQTFSSPMGTGLVVLTTNFRFFVVNNIKDPRIRKFPDIPGQIYVIDFCAEVCGNLLLLIGVNIVPSCWTAMSEDRQTKVIVAKERDIYLLEQSEQHIVQHAVDFSHHFLSILALAVSPCHKHMALLTDAGENLEKETVDSSACNF